MLLESCIAKSLETKKMARVLRRVCSEITCERYSASVLEQAGKL